MPKDKHPEISSLNGIDPDTIQLNIGTVNLLLIQSTENLLSFLGINNSILFINTPFKNSIKILSYVNNLKKNLKNVIDEINKEFSFEKQINEFGYFDKLIIATYLESRNWDKIIIESAGLDGLSMMKFLNFCLELTEKHKEKMILLVDGSLHGKIEMSQVFF